MARLMLPADMEIATGTLTTGGKADFTIDPTGLPGKVEIWDRILSFPPPGPVPPPPAFANKSGVFASTTPISKTVPLAGLYQVRLYREGEGNATGDGNVLDQLNFPCVLSDSGRSDFLTRCARVPQIEIAPGGTFVSLAFAASKRTMSRAQLAAGTPHLVSAGFPVFPDGSVRATAHSESTGAQLLHKLAMSDGRMLPGHKFFFIILVWDSNGNWDFVWNPAAAAPAAPPEPISTKRRLVDIRITKLWFLDDTDDLSNGEGAFTLNVQQGSLKPQTNNRPIGTFESGTETNDDFPPIKITLGPEVVSDAQRDVRVGVTGSEDDGEKADTGMTPLQFPLGEGREDVTDSQLSLSGNGDDLRFVARVLYSVKYYQ